MERQCRRTINPKAMSARNRILKLQDNISRFWDRTYRPFRNW